VFPSLRFRTHPRTRLDVVPGSRERAEQAKSGVSSGRRSVDTPTYTAARAGNGPLLTQNDGLRTGTLRTLRTMLPRPQIRRSERCRCGGCRHNLCQNLWHGEGIDSTSGRRWQWGPQTSTSSAGSCGPGTAGSCGPGTAGALTRCGRAGCSSGCPAAAPGAQGRGVGRQGCAGRWRVVGRHRPLA
jgi:hypothetical protein